MTEERDRMELEAWLRGLNRSRISRRDALRYAGMGAGAFGLSALLAACGVQGRSPTTSPPGGTGTGTASPTPSPLPPQAGTVNVANWILYIDLEDGDSATLNAFTEQTGIEINYREDIGDNDEFFGTDLRQQLSSGQPTGWDIIVMTDWMIAKLIRLGWLQPLHYDRLPNVTQYHSEKFTDPYFDPGRQYSVTWAAGITGIGYNRELTGRPITSINDLFDPAFAGRVGMFKEMRDTINFALFLDGVRPDDATLEDVGTAVERLRQQRDAGIVRAYYGNEYTDPLANGDLALCMAWSGDINALRLDNPALEFVVPDEGGNRWSDSMAIPLYAEHPTDAHEWINFVYQPEIAAGITEWVWYESGLEEDVVRGLIREHAEEDEELVAVAESELVWPSEEVLANTFGYKVLSEEEEAAWHELFDPLLAG